MASTSMGRRCPYLHRGTATSLGVGFDWVANNADLNGNGFELRNNTIENHRARRMLIKGSNGACASA
jgi:hypothetical protein